MFEYARDLHSLFTYMRQMLYYRSYISDDFKSHTTKSCVYIQWPLEIKTHNIQIFKSSSQSPIALAYIHPEEVCVEKNEIEKVRELVHNKFREKKIPPRQINAAFDMPSSAAQAVNGIT